MTLDESTISANNDDLKQKPEISWEELVSRCTPIANPLASRKLCKKIYKCVRKADKVKRIRRGIRDVQKFIRKGERGMVVLAGDTFPIDVISHLPIVCEDHDLPYCYVPSKEDLGTAGGTKRMTCAMLIKSHEDYKELYDTCFDTIKSLPPPI